MVEFTEAKLIGIRFYTSSSGGQDADIEVQADKAERERDGSEEVLRLYLRGELVGQFDNDWINGWWVING